MAALSPLDLLTLPDDERAVVQSLTRQPRQTLSELAAASHLSVDHLESLLRRMVSGGWLIEQLNDGERRFSVRFGQQRRKRNLPPALLQLFAQTPETILATTVLTTSLSETERQELLAKSTRRTLLPNEVYSWQGDTLEHIGLVGMGLLKKSHLFGKQRVKTTNGYVRRAEWFGVSEGLSTLTCSDTYTAVTETELILWSVADFLDFASRYPHLSMTISRFMSEQLQHCHCQQQQGVGMLWVIESLHAGAGATTLAVNLAILAAQSYTDQETGRSPRVVLWELSSDMHTLVRLFEPKSTEKEALLPGQKRVLQCENGLDVLLEIEHGDYPPLVELDILLTTLQKHYDYVICDTGASTTDEFVLRLRGRAQTLITVTRDPESTSQALSRWSLLKPYAPPGQKRVLTLNGLSAGQAAVNPTFHVVLPEAGAILDEAATNRQALVEYVPNNRLSSAFAEVYRRLSLTQTVAIFIPSTVDVDQIVENEVQVQAALSFLGHLFGGATSSDAEGVWQSEESGLVIEKVSIVRSFASEKALKKHLDDVIAFASQIKEEMKQEAVAIDVNNELVLI